MIALALIGIDRIDPSNVTWIRDDQFQAYEAWMQYRWDRLPALSLSTGRLMGDIPIRIAMYDPVPVLAFSFRLLDFVLPEIFQYNGSYLALCFVLQGLFSFLLLFDYATSNANWRAQHAFLAAFLGAALFATAPILVWRIQFMVSPSSHWLIIATLWAILIKPKRIYFLCLLFFVAGGISPYILTMMGLIMLVNALCEYFFVRRSSWAEFLPVGFGVVSLWFFGFLPTGEGVIPGVGYGEYSSHLLALVDSDGTWSRVLPDIPNGKRQYEGFGYLGLGCLFLFSVGLLFTHKSMNAITAQLAIVAILGLLVAASFRITIGPYQLFELHLPSRLISLLTIFRSSGRFVWLAVYCIMAFSLLALIGAMSPRKVIPIILFGLSLQFVDISPGLASVQTYFASTRTPTLPQAPWSTLPSNFDRIVVVPPWQCSSSETPFGSEGSMKLGAFALKRKVALNSSYAGRLPWEQWHICEQYLSMRSLVAPVEKRSLYVIAPSWAASIRDGLNNSHHCDESTDAVICVPSMNY